MKNKIVIFILVALLPILGFAQTKLTEVNISKTVRTAVPQNKIKRNSIEKKFSSGLHEVIAQYKLNGNTLQPKPGVPKIESVGDDQKTIAQIDTKDRIHVYLHVTGKNTVTSVIKSLKAKRITVESFNEKMKLIQVWLTPAQLTTAASLGAVGYVDLITAPIHSTGPVNSQGVARLRSDVSANLMGADGSGIKVGVMSDDCGTLENLVNPRIGNELAGGANSPVILDDSWANPGAGTRTHEGLAMMEIVQDVAPLAKLYYATAFTGLVNFANNVNALAGAGCRVITDDIIYFLEPVFEDGPLSQTIDNVCSANNVVYTSASTNFANNNTYFFNYNNLAGQSISGSPGFNVANFNGAGDFQNQITVNNGQTVIVSLHWDDKYGASGNDYDLYLVNSTNTVLLAASTGNQTGTQDPNEILSFQNTSGVAQTYQVIVARFALSGTDPNPAPRMRLFVFRNSSMEYTNKTTSTLGHPTAANALGVGAIDVSGNNYNTIENFSSQGPTNIINFAVPGSRNIITTRIKPDISSFDGGVTSVPGFNPFFGTSAAAPHAAGVAAQLLSLFPGLTGAQARAALINGCIDYGAAGADNVFGAGRLDAFKTIAQVRASSTPNTWASAFTTPSLAITDNNAAGVNSTIGVPSPCPGITPDSVYVSVTIDGHNKTGDLKITLKSPDNTTITLMDRPVSGAGTGTAKNPNVVLGDVASSSIQTANPAGAEEMGFYIPANVISSPTGFRGHSIGGGSWTLNVSDNAATNTGILKDWGLMFKEGAPTPPTFNITWTPPFIFPNDHTLRNISVVNSLAGGCTPSVVLQSLVSNEPDAGTGGGDVAGDIQGATTGTNDLAWQVRSECSPDAPFGKGRYYTATYRVTDIGGYQRDTMFAIPVLCTPGRVDPSTDVPFAGLTLDVAPSPNPVVGTSTISYTIPGPASAEMVLNLSNNMGKWVKSLDYGVKGPGTYTISWNGSAADGTPLPPGVYTYQLSVGAPYNALKTGVAIKN